MSSRRIVTLTTDYGTTGPYAGSIRGAILESNPDAQVIDITHDISRGDIREAAFVLRCAYDTFPDGTIHVVVVDPGVGGSRRGVLVSTERHYFVAPDNGVLSYIYEAEEIYGAVSLQEDHFFRKPVSATFHGRDIFGPVAGWMARLMDGGRFGPPVSDLCRFDPPRPVEVKPQAWKGPVIHVDRFGNCITCFTTRHIPLDENGLPHVSKVLTVAGEVVHLARTYGDAPSGTPCLLLGGTGYFEVAINGGSATETLGLRVGHEVGIILK